MNQKVEKILGFAVRFILLKAFWVFPAVYLLVSMLTYIFGAEGHFSFPALVFFTVIGALTYSVTRSWLSHEYDTNELDFIGLSEEDDPENMKTSILDFFTGMPYWEKILWGVVLVLLIVTAIMTANGFSQLFLHSTSTLMYVVAAVLMVAFLVLLMMISRRRVIIGIVLLYILLMAPTGFLFTHEYVYSSLMTQRDLRLAKSFFDSKQSQLREFSNLLDQQSSQKKRTKLADVQQQVQSLFGKAGELEALLSDANWLTGSDENLSRIHSKAVELQQQVEAVANHHEMKNLRRIKVSDELTEHFFSRLSDLEGNRINGVKALLQMASGKQPDMENYSRTTLKVSMLVAIVITYLPLVLAMLVAVCRKRDDS